MAFTTTVRFPAADRVTTYLVIGDPPLNAGALQVSDACPSWGVEARGAMTAVGAVPFTYTWNKLDTYAPDPDAANLTEPVLEAQNFKVTFPWELVVPESTWPLQLLSALELITCTGNPELTRGLIEDSLGSSPPFKLGAIDEVASVTVTKDPEVTTAFDIKGKRVTGPYGKVAITEGFDVITGVTVWVTTPSL